VRKIQIMKLRGQASVPGLHTFRIGGSGLQIFPRTFGLEGKSVIERSGRRLSTGIPELDTMLGGGVPEGDSILVAGPSGTGKSVIASQCIAAGTSAGEPGIIAVFEERPQAFTGRAASLGLDLDTPQSDGLLKVLYLRPLDLSVDETLQELLDAVKAVGAKRIVIDSLAGFEMALAPAFRQDFRESLYRMIGALTGTGATVMSTVELTESFTDLLFSPYAISFLTDDIIRLRYVEIDGALHKILAVVKMRGGHHSKELREYTITDAGLEIGECPRGLRGLITGVPMRVDSPSSK
jgi:circadian clock protein KaiC